MVIVMSMTPAFRAVDLLARAATAAAKRKGDPLAAQPVEKRRAQQPPTWALPNPPQGVTTEDTMAGSVPVRVYRPQNPDGVGLLYIHGGGFMVGGIMACDHICRDLADKAGAVVVSVDYRLAPEDPYPAGLDDCAEALDWLLANAGELGIDPTRVVVGGDSAGGNLTVALCLRAKDVPVAGQIVVYPMLDLTCSRDSWVSEGVPYMNREQVLGVIGRYYGEADVKDPLVSPLFAEDLSGMPPAIVVTAHHDPLRDDGADFAAALELAGVTVQYLDYPRMIHAFLSWPRLTKRYGECLDVLAGFLRATSARTL